MVFTYAYLDIQSRTLISKNNVLLTEYSAVGDMVATRHANGRDWWLFKSGLLHKEYHRWLLSPQGFDYDKIIIDQLPDSLRRNGTLSYINMEGNKFITFGTYYGNASRTMYEYDFDRCSGELSNPIMHNLRDSLPAGQIYNFCISPDGSKAYIGRANFISLGINEGTLQYDLNTSTWTRLNSQGSGIQLSPNGKALYAQGGIVENSNPMKFWLHQINQPNEQGLACNYELNKYQLDNVTYLLFPSNFANFRLGAAQGTVCDSLGLSNLAIEDEKTNWHLFPNPNNGQFSISFEKWQGGHYVLHNSVGQQVAQALLLSGEIHILHLQNLQPGLYVITLFDQKKQAMGSKRLVVLQN